MLPERREQIGIFISNRVSVYQGVARMQISVIMPAYNAERFIAEAIESVLAQTYKDFEFIILDDGSKDRTLEIAQSYARRDSRVRVESHPNMGLAATENKGLALAANEWIARMDADDVLMPNRLESNLAFLEEHPECTVVGGWCRHIDTRGRIIGKTRSSMTTHEAVQALCDANEMISFNCCTALFRKSAVLAIGGYRPQFSVTEDADMWTRLLEAGHKILIQPEYLALYRIHDGSVSVARAQFQRKQLRWAKDCMLRRRRGEAELSWEEFLSMRRALPWYLRLNAERKDGAKVLYKAAVFQYARRNYFLLVPTIIAAILLQPGYTIQQIKSKLVLRRS
jgi:glycosyltransferase involved in cell wall biosynthesis